MFLYRCYIVL